MRLLTIIAAMDRARCIGRAGQLPWRLPEDLKRFKALTIEHAVIMGRKTLESIGCALPRRFNYAVTRNPDALAARPEFGAVWLGSFEEALTATGAAIADPSLPQVMPPEVFIIGGADVYGLALPLTTRMLLTLVDQDTPGGDAFFPEWDPAEWEQVSSVEAETFAGRFVELVRRA
ncbi:MAG: dihydrofolate reductase [Polyangiaceae bacterium]|nr:dihydrofolate reductase [Polyangiaceae bacterium]